jgi:DNA repair protein RAD5
MAEVSEADKKPLFFGSDTEDEAEAEQTFQMEVDSNVQPRVAANDTSSKRLFFPSSDDESDSGPSNIPDVPRRRAAEPRSSISVRDSAPAPGRRASSIISIQSNSPSPAKKRKTSPLAAKSNVNINVNKPQKKSMNEPVRQTSSMIQAVGFDYKYIGAFLVPNAWSTCKGRGWVKAGETIHIRRNEEEAAASSSKLHAKTNTKKVATVSGKQIKLTNIFKAQSKTVAPFNPMKRLKEDNVVRFTNERGFGKCDFTPLDCM